jgi:hypothetical protein
LRPKRQQKIEIVRGRTNAVHKERAVCSAVDDTIPGRPAAAVGPIDLLRPARAFPTVSAALGCQSSRIDRVSKPEIRKAIRKHWIPRNPREINKPALTRGIVLAA